MSIVGLVTVIVGEEWVSEAICPQTDVEEFFPEQGASAPAAKAVCRGCPVRIQCLDYALEHNESHGVWGGFTPQRADASGAGTEPPTENTLGECVATQRAFHRLQMLRL